MYMPGTLAVRVRSLVSVRGSASNMATTASSPRWHAIIRAVTYIQNDVILSYIQMSYSHTYGCHTYNSLQHMHTFRRMDIYTSDISFMYSTGI